jgi:hypothetical protein
MAPGSCNSEDGVVGSTDQQACPDATQGGGTRNDQLSSDGSNN